MTTAHGVLYRDYSIKLIVGYLVVPATSGVEITLVGGLSPLDAREQLFEAATAAGVDVRAIGIYTYSTASAFNEHLTKLKTLR